MTVVWDFLRGGAVADRRNTIRQALVDEIGNLIPQPGCSRILNDINWHHYRSGTPAVL